MKTIAVLNQKGGVGKTTTTVNVAAALAQKGLKVLAIDLDPQSHLTIHLGLEPQNIEAGSYKVLTQNSTIQEQLSLIRPNLWLLPANIDLVGAESELVSIVGRETILREALQQLQIQFDYVFIDCAPSLGLLTLNALATASDILTIFLAQACPSTGTIISLTLLAAIIVLTGGGTIPKKESILLCLN